MKTRYLKWLITAAAVCVVGLALMGAAESSESTAVRELLKKRSVIMEDVLFGKITYEEGKKQLKEIETDKLYNDDVNALLEYRNTDLDKIERMDIVKLEQKSRIYDRMTFYAKIKWVVSGMSEVCEETCEYNVGVAVENGCYRLISFEIQGKQ